MDVKMQNFLKLHEKSSFPKTFFLLSGLEIFPKSLFFSKISCNLIGVIWNQLQKWIYINIPPQDRRLPKSVTCRRTWNAAHCALLYNWCQKARILFSTLSILSFMVYKHSKVDANCYLNFQQKHILLWGIIQALL